MARRRQEGADQQKKLEATFKRAMKEGSADVGALLDAQHSLAQPDNWQTACRMQCRHADLVAAAAAYC